MNTAATVLRTARPESGAMASITQEVSRQHETRTTQGRAGRPDGRGNPRAATTSTNDMPLTTRETRDGA